MKGFTTVAYDIPNSLNRNLLAIARELGLSKKKMLPAVMMMFVQAYREDPEAVVRNIYKVRQELLLKEELIKQIENNKRKEE